MPVDTVCSFCSAKLKVRDELMGRSIKCPKCTKVFKIGSENQEEIEVQPVTKKAVPWASEAKSAPWDAKAKKSPGEERKANKKGPPSRNRFDEDDEDADEKPKKSQLKTKSKSKHLDVDDDDDEDASFQDLLDQTTLPDTTKQLIAKELGRREKGVWVGQPCPKIMTVRAVPKVIGGLFFLTIASILLGAAGIMGAGLPAIVVVPLIGVGYLLIALLVAVGIPIMDRRKALATAYVVTNKRCIVFNGRWFGQQSGESYYSDVLVQMRPMASWIFGDGAGDLVFRSVTTVTTTHHARGGSSTSVSTTYYGFLGIRHMEEAERIIRVTLLDEDDDDEDD